MGFFNDDEDPFDEIFKEFFGSKVARSRKQNFTKGEEEERYIDFIEDSDKIYLVFELPGYNEKDIMVVVKGNEIEIKAQKVKKEEGMQDYLFEKLNQVISIRKTLPKNVNLKKFSHEMKNGILEVAFDKR